MRSEQVFTGYDAVDNDYFAQGAKEVGGQKSEVRQKYNLPENYFLASARFIPKKNLNGLIRAFARYRELSSDVRSPTSDLWHLVILGDGPLNADLRSLISNLRPAARL
jgi:glycosyltransferase involved in cell wall biosynthesis